MPLVLPQNDRDPSVRNAELEIERSAWLYGCWEHLHCFIKRVPLREMPRLAWVRRIAPAVLRVALNRVLYKLATRFEHELTTYKAKRWRGRVGASGLVGVPEAFDSDARRFWPWRMLRGVQLLGYRFVHGCLGQILAKDRSGSDPSCPFPRGLRSEDIPPRRRPDVTIDDFKKIYQALPVPPLAAGWTATKPSLTDDEFAWLRLAGPNPEMLEYVDHVPEEFPSDFGVEGLGTLGAIAADGRLFLADYSVLAMLENSTWHDLPRFVGAPRVLFAAREKRLVALAIQCRRGGAVFRPGDPGWPLAKQVVQVADGNYHELITHLGRTHLLVEIFLMATRRNLAPRHPLHRLLIAHFEGTAFINDQARNGLIAPGGQIDQIFAGTIESSRMLAIQSLTSLDLATYDLPTRIRLRGVIPSLLPEYPWRDDALAVWGSIERFVRDYVGLFYTSPGDVAADNELKEWSTVLSRPVPDGGVPGFAAPTTIDELVRLVTLVIYTASAQHAAVNFPQYPIMSFSPMVAGAGWAPGPDVSPLSTLIEFLPPRQVALSQAETLYLLSSVHHTRLGYYEDDWFGDPAIDALVRRFQDDLRRVETEIEDANRKRRAPYPYLLPSLIPQSINI